MIQCASSSSTLFQIIPDNMLMSIGDGTCPDGLQEKQSVGNYSICLSFDKNWFSQKIEEKSRKSPCSSTQQYYAYRRSYSNLYQIFGQGQLSKLIQNVSQNDQGECLLYRDTCASKFFVLREKCAHLCPFKLVTTEHLGNDAKKPFY